MSEKDRHTEMGRATLLAVLITFVVLRLTGDINWSWIWVVSPLWIPLSVDLLVAIIRNIFTATRDVIK